METQAEQPAGGAFCPTCGSPTETGAATCAVCGAVLMAAASPPPTDIALGRVPSPAPTPTHVESGAVEPAHPMPPATPALAAADQKRCDWCGASNPHSAERCQSCHAMFPKPELDEAMRRAAEVRIQSAEDDIAFRQRVRKRRGLRWLFATRKGDI